MPVPQGPSFPIYSSSPLDASIALLLRRRMLIVQIVTLFHSPIEVRRGRKSNPMKICTILGGCHRVVCRLLVTLFELVEVEREGVVELRAI